MASLAKASLGLWLGGLPPLETYMIGDILMLSKEQRISCGAALGPSPTTLLLPYCSLSM